MSDEDDDDDDNDKEEKSDDDVSFQADEVSHGSEEEPEQRRLKKKKRTTAGRPKGATRRQWPKDQEKALTLECTGKPYLLKAQHSAFNISDSTTIPLTVQNWQITSFVPDSTNKHSTDKQRNFRVPDSTKSSLCTVIEKGISKRNDGRSSARSRCLFRSNEEVSSCTKVARYQGQSEEYAGQRCQKMKTVGNFKDFQFKTFLFRKWYLYRQFLYFVNAELT